jgi:type I restriction enzyme S subunit
MSQLPRYESYKDSGIQWLGEIPSHWAVKKLKFLTSYFKGFAFKSEDFSDIGIPLIKASNVKKFSIENVESHIAFEKVQDAFDRVKLQEGDLILSTVGSLPNVLNSAVGQIAYVSPDFSGSYLNQNNVCFRSNEKVLPIFLKYFVMSSFFRRNLDVKALWIANQAYLEVLDVQNIYIIFPDLDEQKIIADFLDKRLAQVDALIAKQETLLEKLSEQRVALISHAVTKGLNPDVEMKASGVEWLGKVPKSWDIANLRYFISCNSGDALESSRILRDADEFNNIPVIGGNGFLGFTENSNYKKECIAVGRVGALCGNVHFINYESWINDNALLIKLISDKFNINYLVYLLRSRNLNELASKTAQPLLTGTQVKAEKVCIPLMSEQLEIVKYLDTNLETLDKLLETVNKTTQTLREYRSTLITQVVTGKIDVRNLKVN